MDFSLSAAQQALGQEMTEFAANALEYDLVRRDHTAEFVEENWQKCARKGVFGLYVPEEYGGRGLDLVTTVHAMYAFGYGCPDNGLTLGINGQMWGVQEIILQFGTEAQKQKYLPGLLDGRLKGGLGMTEPHSGSDPFSLTTTAVHVPEKGGYLLNGKKVYIGLGPVAGIVVAFASTHPEAGRWGISAFIVDGDAPGLTLGAAKEKMGVRTGPMGDVIFEDVFVPEENLIGEEGSGASIFSACMTYERSFIFASHVGSMARQLDKAVEYAKSREQGGQPIGKYQAVSHRIADMLIRLETARLFMYKAAWMLENGEESLQMAAMAKLVMSELFVENSLDAIRVHGGVGYLSEHGIERDLRDALGGVIYSGTSDIQKNIIAGLLGL